MLSLRLSKTIKYLLLLLVTFHGHQTLFSQESIIKEYRIAFKEAKHDTTRVNILVALSNLLYATKPDTVIPLCKQALLLIENKLIKANQQEKAVYQKLKAGALNNIAATHKNNGDIGEAMDYFHRSVKLYEEINDKKGLAHTLNNIGAIHDNQGDIAKALDYFSKSLNLLEEIGDKKGVAASLNNIGFIYSNQGNTNEALEYYHKSLKIREEIDDKKGISNSLSNIGGIYKKQGDISKALSHWNKSLAIREILLDKKGIANALTNIGSVFQDYGDPNCTSRQTAVCMLSGINKALLYYERALQLLKDHDDKQGVAKELNSIAGIYFKLATLVERKSEKQKNIQLALDYAKNSLVMSKELGFPESIKGTEYTLSLVDSVRGNFAGALEHYKQFIIYRDSISNESTRKASVKNQLKYEYEKKEAVMKEQQEKERVVAEEKNRFQKIVIMSVVIGLILVIIFAAFVFRTLKTTRKQKLIIEHKQKEILDSIYYARRIQKVLMPHEKYITRALKSLKS